MKYLMRKEVGYLAIALFFYFPVHLSAQAQESAGFVSRDAGVKGLFDALSAKMNKPVVLSKIAVKKRITGEFDLESPRAVLSALSRQLGLIWYDDGQSIYIYDASEIKSALIVLENTRFSVVTEFLKTAGLYDGRYPLKGKNGEAAFYISGPPVYVELVTKVAQSLDKNPVRMSRENIAIIPLRNTFVEDRTYRFRSENITIPGVARVVSGLLDKNTKTGSVDKPTDLMPPSESYGKMPPFPDAPGPAASSGVSASDDDGIMITADPGSNSIIAKGNPEQINYVRNLIEALDTKKRHIELSVWIIDFKKEAFEKLGVQWSGSLNMGSSLGIAFNGGTSTIDGASFLAKAMALSEKQQANIVSRPMILTQENVPAIFDNNRTLYSKLIGERTAQLQDITYGTAINVWPRFTANDEIEMMLNVEDGSQYSPAGAGEDNLPEVGKTLISTVARVPKGKSLLIGGYTKDEDTHVKGKIPWLGDLPWVGSLFRYTKESSSNQVRVFLIQPREITAPLVPDAHIMVEDIKRDLAQDRLQNWMNNYLDSQKWQ